MATKPTRKAIPKRVQQIYEEKEKRRRDLAKLPFEEKIRILVQLQKIAQPLRKSRFKPWKLHDK